MGIGIGISVDARQVKEARKEVEFLNKTLQETEESGDFAPGKEGLETTGKLVKQITEDIRRMKGLVVKGEQQGNLLNKNQFQEAATLSKRIGQNMAEYTKEISKARNELSKLLAEKLKLERTSTADPKKWVAAQEQLESLAAREKELRQHYNKIRKYDPRAQEAARRGAEYSGAIGGYGDAPDGSGSGGGNSIAMAKKALGLAVAAAGGLSIYGFIASSRAKYQHAIQQEDPLWAKGIRSYRSGDSIGLGVSPTEHMHLLSSISRSTGLNDRTGIRESALSTEIFAKSQGLSLDEAANLRSTIYQATGKAGNLPNNVMMSLTAQGIEKSRMPELLQQIQKNTGVIAQAQKGAGLSDKQMAMALFASIQAIKGGNKESAVFAKSGEFSNIMQNGLTGAGTPAGEIMLFQAMGGFDGPMDWEKLRKMRQMREGGFYENPDLLKKIIGYLPGGTAEDKAEQLATLNPNWNLSSKSSLMMVKAFDKGGILADFPVGGTKEQMLKKLEGLVAGGNGQAKELLKEIEKNPALSKQAKEAKQEALEIKVGEKLHAAFGGVQNALIDLTNAVLKGDWKETFNVLSRNIKVLTGVVAGVGLIILGKKFLSPGTAAMGGAAAAGGTGLLGKAWNAGKSAGKFILGKGATALGALKPLIGGSVAAPLIGATGLIAGPMAYGYYKSKEMSSDLATKYSNLELKKMRDALTAGNTSTGSFSGAANLDQRNRIDAAIKLRKTETQYDEMFQKAGEKHGVDWKLLKAMAKQESGFNPKAKSRKGATGILQLMPGTARGLGVRNSEDPEDNIMGGAKYISKMIRMSGGNVKEGLQRYNAGPGTVNAVKAGKRGFKPETLEYTDKVMRYYADFGGAGAQTGNITTQSQTGNVAAPAQAGNSELQQIEALLNQIVLNTQNLNQNRMAPAPVN